MTLYDLLYNQRWRFHSINNNAKLEELTVHSYDTKLKEKWDTYSIKDIILIDL